MISQPTPFRRGVLDRAIRQVGSLGQLARACGVTSSAITNARARGIISSELAKAIEEATAGRVTVADLRPDPAGPRRRRNGG
jgi:DNA-binding transcriptional regulator YdaS (Cro superfamily)